MANRTFKQMQKARKSGLTAVDLLRMKEVAKKNADAMETQAIEKAFLFMLAIPLNVLVNDYWPKSARKRAPEFIESVLSLYDAVNKGVVTEEELAELLRDYGQVEVEAAWLDHKVKGE